MSDAAARVAAVLASGRIAERRAPATEPWDAAPPEPSDLAALYAATDGLLLDDGTTVLRRAAITAATAWLKGERALAWPEDLLVVGEREDLVVVLDLDLAGVRAGGGVVEAPTDGLEHFRRVASGLVDYLASRAGLGHAEPPPEIAARDAADVASLAAALARPFYPGAQRDFAVAATRLGVLRGQSDDTDGAMEAFERAIAARVAGARRGAEDLERAAARRACAAACVAAGLNELAARLA